MLRILQALRGTQDILPDNIYKWNHVESVIKELCALYGYSEIRTPMFEDTKLFLRGIGDTTDVVAKEMYTFEDRGGRSITLRPENTAAVVRSYLEHKLYGDQQVHKLFYIGSMFRYDRPQAGRYREFHQFGVEVLGASSPAADAEVINLAYTLFKTLGLKELELHINSIGDYKCRPIYRQKLIEFFEEKEKQIYLYLDNSKYFSSFIKNDLKYIHNKLLIQEENYSNIGIFDLINMPAKIELDQSNQLYGEMIDNIALKIEKLVEQGVSKKDIVIINPINTPVLDYEISNKLSSKNIDILTIKNNSKLIDYQYGNVLYVAVTIYCKKQQYIKEEEYINFIQILFNLNRLEAYRVYKNRDNDENYKSVIKYIDTKRDEKLDIGEFLTKFYIDKVLNLNEGLNNVFICKNIISESEAFVDTLEKLNLKDNKDADEIFIISLKKFIKDYFIARDIEDIKNKDAVLITTSYSYIANNIDRKIQIWVDIGSNTWNMKIEKDLANPLVLKKSFKDGEIYTSEIEENYKKYYMYNTVYNLLKNAENIYAYKSEYSINGYIQEGGLYSTILRLIDRGGENID